MTQNKLVTKNTYLLLLLLILLTIVFYGNTFRTWFQQDEWSALGIYLRLSPSEVFIQNLTPSPRFAFTPFSAVLAEPSLLWFVMAFSDSILTATIITPHFHHPVKKINRFCNYFSYYFKSAKEIRYYWKVGYLFKGFYINSQNLIKKEYGG